MNFLTLPKALYSHPNIKKILFDNQSCILFKQVSQDLLQQEKIATSHSFIFIVSGCVEVQTPTGEVIKASAGEMLFMPRDAYLISDYIMQDDSIKMYMVFIDHDIINAFLGSKIALKKTTASQSVVCKVSSNKSIEQYFHAVKHVYADFKNDKDLLKIKILEFLHLIYANNQTNIIQTLYASEQSKQHRDIAALMLDNYDKNLTVSDFASLSGRSLSSFNRDFKRKYGKPPKQWLIEKRMFKAITLLSNGSSVADCAMDVGYSNVSHFIKSYKSIYGKTPSEMKGLHN
jgi:AraC-like DNA-binding protein